MVTKKRGSIGNHRLAEGLKEVAISLIEERYPDFGPTLAQEKLKEVHDLKISISTVRALMIEKEKKILTKNLTFQYKNTIYGVQTDLELYTLRNASVVIHEPHDESIEVFYKGKKLVLKTYEEQQKQIGEVDSKQLNAIVDELVKISEGKRAYKRSRNHPWKRFVKKNHGVIRI